jgi:dTDP-4-amino-4,6-dideoxygalactose transaminase
MNNFDRITEFEQELSKFTGAPYVVMTDCCTHAIELCMRYEEVKVCSFPAHTYLSIPMTMLKLDIDFDYTGTDWIGEYQFENTLIWDSARLLRNNMYRKGQMQCLSFGYSKPLEIGRGGAILLDDKEAFHTLIRMRYDGRDLGISPWEEQVEFDVGYHYKPTPEEAIIGLEKLHTVDQEPKYFRYPDLRTITINY